MFDAVIIGGGPAGSTAGRLLAEWGHSVVILAAPSDPRRALAECLPPSNRKLFQFLGILDTIDAAGFYRTTGNTVWWGGGERRVEHYPEGWGYQVRREAFDSVLLQLANTAGARVRPGKAVARDGPRIFSRGEEIHARFTLDCSGRAGVLSRLLGYREPERRTVAICGVLKNSTGWKVPDETHTLVEQYESGWAWSVPVSKSERFLAFMGQKRRNFALELVKTSAFRSIFDANQLAGAPWGRDATVYTTRQFCGPGWAIAGDAGATIDPLSSFGVKKAMVSGWMAAVVANTCLRKPEREAAALSFFEKREREVAVNYGRLTEAWYTSVPPGTIEKLKAAAQVSLRQAKAVEPRPAIDGNVIVLRDEIANVNARRLVEVAVQRRQVPDMYEAYCRDFAPVSLPDFLTALATFITEGVLTGI
jgi:FAD-dependent halogenase